MAGVVRRGAVVGSVVLVVVAAVAAGSGAAARAAQHVRTLKVGDTFLARGASGRLPGATGHAVGRVVIRGSWNGGAWRVVTTTRTDASGRYRFVVKPSRRGTLKLRITPPDRYQQSFTLHVV
ncbi:MAG TPA: hypothetical protein VGC78_12905 [Gaiellaceae bacterium]